MNFPVTLANVGTKLLNNAFSVKATLDDDLRNFPIIFFNLMQSIVTASYNISNLFIIIND